VTLLFDDLEGPCSVVTRVGATNHKVVSSAAHVINGELERQLWVAVNSDVDEVGDGDGLSNGKAGEQGGGGELHVDAWLVGSDGVVVG
jgi:hypothetical protein